MREQLLRMNEDAVGEAILGKAGIARFVPVRDEDYDDIRRMALHADGVTWEQSEPTLKRLPGASGRRSPIRRGSTRCLATLAG